MFSPEPLSVASKPALLNQAPNPSFKRTCLRHAA